MTTNLRGYKPFFTDLASKNFWYSRRIHSLELSWLWAL